MRAGAIRATAGSKSANARRSLAYPSGIVVGIAVMYFLDPSQGRRRRHMSRDRALKLVRRTRREAARKARYAEGVAEGRLHEVTGDGMPRPQPDDITLARKVESEIFRDADAPKGSVNVNAEHGIVYLRGQAGSREWMERLIAAAEGVEGVKDVKNMLHVPD
jgi:osmotically-inducible protein OsmY